MPAAALEPQAQVALQVPGFSFFQVVHPAPQQLQQLDASSSNASQTLVEVCELIFAGLETACHV